ncbi:3-hydroxyacyl-CoA dehydrogenase NAD-binding domain-containing protein [Kitasatospora sp. NPDC058218]|uniref:3-hydroxyacyl-CoA dehydrogenase NAD-binding domain-containing protein n=1 Tax=Kitasatospora sp. NPDC058218 TaxID=3346385 RepID=UPI0036DC43A3
MSSHLAAQAPATYREAATALVLAYVNRAVALSEEVAVPRTDIDTAMRLGCGLPEGPFETVARLGVPQVHRALTELWKETGDIAFAPAAALLRPGIGRSSVHGSPVVPEPGPEVPPVGRLGILGAGTMARGIAEAAALAGLPTLVVARGADSARRARVGVDSSLDRAVRRGRATQRGAAEAMARLRFEADPALLGDCDLVVEAVAEDEAVKREVFARLGALCRPGTVLATTTSSLSVARCTEPAGRPERLVGLHFFNPAPLMRLVEFVPLPETGVVATATARSLCVQLGKTVVQSPDRSGFIVNYLLFPYLARALRLAERTGIGPEALDTAIVDGHGFPMGPFALLDTIGLDVSLAILERLHGSFREPDFEPPQLLRRYLAEGCLGRKNRRGFRTA